MNKNQEQDKVVLSAIAYLTSDGSIIQSGMNLAGGVLKSLQVARCVRISLVGLRGLSSSYFNVLLQRIAEEAGLEAINSRVEFAFDTEQQEDVLGRSLNAVTNRIKSAGSS